MGRVSDPVLDVCAENWLTAMVNLWKPNGRRPHTEAERAALALEHGLAEWRPGDRYQLIAEATRRPISNEAAFVTLALRDWMRDFDARHNFWLLPYELAASWLGRELDLSTIRTPRWRKP